MCQDAFGRTNEIRTASLLGSESDDDGSGVGQSDLSCNGRPATERGTLEMKEEKDTAKEAFDAAAFAQFRFRPGGRQAERDSSGVWGSRGRQPRLPAWHGSRR